MKKSLISLFLASTFVFSCYVEDEISGAGKKEDSDTYKITFIVGDKTSEKFFKEGTMPSYGVSNPVKESSNTENYTFSHWEPEFSTVTGEATYTAIFDSSVRKYLVTFKNGEEVLQQSHYEYGTTPSLEGSNPTKEQTHSETYTFSGWDPAISEVTRDITYNAVFTTAPRQYEIKFKIDGEIVQTDNFDYGSMPSYRGDTSSTIKIHGKRFNFNYWEPSIVNVVQDVIYIANITYIEKEFTLYCFEYVSGPASVGYLYTITDPDSFPKEANTESTEEITFYGYNKNYDRLLSQGKSKVQSTTTANRYKLYLSGNSTAHVFEYISSNNIDGFNDMLS